MKKLVLGVFAIDVLLFVLSRNATRQQAAAPSRELLDLNSAERDELVRLLGPFLADRVIENRPYRNKLDLVSRLVIPSDAYRRISHRVQVDVNPDVEVLTPIAI